MPLNINDPQDWELDEDHDLVVPIRYTTGLAGVKQGVDIAVQMIEGEWFEDLSVGLPLYQNQSVTRRRAILGEKFSPSKARQALRREILKVNGVTAIKLLDVSFNARTRHMTVRVVTKTVFGDIDQTITRGV